MTNFRHFETLTENIEEDNLKFDENGRKFPTWVENAVDKGEIALWLSRSQTSPGWTSLLKTLWEKEKLLVTSNFSFSNSVFYPFWELYGIFITFEIGICKLFEFGRV